MDYYHYLSANHTLMIKLMNENGRCIRKERTGEETYSALNGLFDEILEDNHELGRCDQTISIKLFDDFGRCIRTSSVDGNEMVFDAILQGDCSVQQGIYWDRISQSFTKHLF